MKNKITKKTLLWEIVDVYPRALEILVEDYGLHCFGCGAAQVETLEEGAMAHGLSQKEIKEMVDRLNQEVKKGQTSKKSKQD